MSIFGKLDAASIKTNPYFIEAGEYEAEVVKAEYRKNRDDQNQLFIQYQITSEESMYKGRRASQYFTLPDADLDEEKFALLPVDEQNSIMKVITAMKRTLCGNSANANQKGLGVDENELNGDDWEPGSLVGTKIVLGISNYGEEGVNVRFVNLQD